MGKDAFFIICVMLVAALLGFLIAWFLRNIKINKLQAEIDDLKAENERLRAELDALRVELNSCQTELDRVNGLNEALNSKVLRLTGDLDDCNKIRNELSLQLGANGPEFDGDAAKLALGKKIKLDDLTIVEGIGPMISQLLNNDGIHTWFELSQASVDRLQRILDDGGDRFAIHNPGTWARQAELAYMGKWSELKEWQDYLDGGVDPATRS